MGNVSARPQEPSSIYLANQSRFHIDEVVIVGAGEEVLFRLTPDQYPATWYNATRSEDDNSPVDYVQDPLPSNGPPRFLLRLANSDDLTFHFTITIRQTALAHDASSPQINGSVATSGDNTISSLTYLFASTPQKISDLAVREFNFDPNLHRNPHAQLIGDLTTGGRPSAQVTWEWKWQRPPDQVDDSGGGWRNTCSFVEYNERSDSLDTLATFSFWVQNVPRPPAAAPPSPFMELPVPHSRLRVPSTQSVESRVSNISDSEGEGSYKDYKEAQSPAFEAIPENGLGLVPTITSGGGTAGASPNIPAAPVPGPFKVDVATCKPGEDLSLNEDGPLFRATMRSLEQKTGNMRLRMKKVLRTAQAAEAAQQACNQAVADFTQALKEASITNANAVQPALEHYFERIAKEIFQYEQQNTVNLHRLIIEPIGRLYTFEIKQADAKKREFEEERNHYYAYVKKYLGQRSESLKEKKQKQSDEKYEAKRRTFELKSFDYSSFMHDLHGGRKEQEVLSQLTKYAEAQAKSYLDTAQKVAEMVPQLDALVNEVRSADQDFQLRRLDREEKRRMLETSTKPIAEDGNNAVTTGFAHSNSVRDSLRPGDLDTGRSGSVGGHLALSTSPPVAASTMGSQSSATAMSVDPYGDFNDIRDLDPSFKADAYSMQGILYAPSQPSPASGQVDPRVIAKSFHKFWVVLAEGKLSEYVNWKEKMELHMSPIDLVPAQVHKVKERRFTFMVTTSKLTRYYQAKSEDEMQSWISAINIALQTALESQPLPPTPPSPVQTPVLSPGPSTGSHRKDIAAVLTGKSLSFSGHRQTSNPHRSEAQKAVSRHQSMGDKAGHPRAETESEPWALMTRLRKTDGDNRFCSDCGSRTQVEWCSINLGTIFCIDCAGVHRSLGTHISKVRGLVLDTFTQDIVEILVSLGNRVSNEVWEAKLNNFLKPSSFATPEQRHHFIKQKYIEREYVQELVGAQTADEYLLTSIKRNNVQEVLHALARGANPNARDHFRNTPAVYFALTAADPVAPGSVPPPSLARSVGPPPSATAGARVPAVPSAGTPSAGPTRKPFALAEFLIQNGAQIPTDPSPFPLSESAKEYLQVKTVRRDGRISTSVPPDPAAFFSPSTSSSTAAAFAHNGTVLGSLARPGVSPGPVSLSALPSFPPSPHPPTPDRERERERDRPRVLLKRSSGSRPRSSRHSLAADVMGSIVKKS